MVMVRRIISGIFLLIPFVASSQGELPEKIREISGFIRGGLYSGIDHADNKPYVSSAFSDLSLAFRFENGLNYKAYADIRYRYGVEFLEPVSDLTVREGYVKLYGRKWDLSAGQQIIKWGRADFTNPTSKINPQNYISRSPDRVDMDLGNLLADIRVHPSDKVSLEAAVIPFYRPSVLIIDPMPLPDNVTISQINSLVTDKEMFSYGFRTDFHLKGLDMGVSWFDGSDPMPGIAFKEMSIDLSGPAPVILTQLETKSYKTRVLGMDMEAVAGEIGFRGEAAWSSPYLSYKTNEYVPLNEIKWVAGINWVSGPLRFIVEYSGKVIPGFTPSPVDPVIGAMPDMKAVRVMVADTLSGPEEFIRQQVAAFNRLYNYQLEKYYHSAGVRIESYLVYGKLIPSLYSSYNFTSGDFLIIPEIKFKPADGLTIIAGAEYYSGPDGALYDIIDDFMNNIYAAIRIDF